MGLGLSSAAGVQGGYETLDKLVAQRRAEAMMAQQLQRQAQIDAQNQQNVQADNARADRSVSLQEEIAHRPAAPKGPMTMGEGQSLVDPTTGRIITAIPKPQAPQHPVSVAPGGSLVDPSTGRIIMSRPAAPSERAPHRVVQQGIGPDGKPALLSVDLDTGQAQPVSMPGGFQPNRPAKPVTGAERQTLAFYNRMKDSVDTLEKTGANGEPSLEDQYAQQSLPAQMQAAHAPNMLQTAMQQQYRQAQRAYTEARLRKESGAAIPESEFQNDARTYFAQPGDAPEVKKQKAAARRKVIEGLKFGSGGAYDEFYGQQHGGGQAPPDADPLGLRGGK